jgi:hypothetical protein
VDDQRFDELIKRFGTKRLTRLSALRGLIGGAAAVAGVTLSKGVDAQKKKVSAERHGGKHKKICHCQSELPESCKTIKPRKKAAKKHLKHGCDYEGPCQPGKSGCPRGNTNTNTNTNTETKTNTNTDTVTNPNPNPNPNTDTVVTTPQCTGDQQCTNPNFPFCMAETCIQCRGGQGCRQNETCIGNVCVPDDVCTPGQCPVDEPICHVDSGDCEPCQNDGECLALDPNFPICNETTGKCVECETDTDCVAGETCDKQDDVCVVVCKGDRPLFCPGENEHKGKCCPNDDVCVNAGSGAVKCGKD